MEQGEKPKKKIKLLSTKQQATAFKYALAGLSQEHIGRRMQVSQSVVSKWLISLEKKNPEHARWIRKVRDKRLRSYGIREIEW